MFFWTCITAGLLCWAVVGGLVVALIFAPHWVIAVIALAAALLLAPPNVRGRRR